MAAVYRDLIRELNELVYYGEPIGLKVVDRWLVLGKPTDIQRKKKYPLSLAMNTHWNSVGNCRFDVNGLEIHDAIITGLRALEDLQWFYNIGLNVHLHNCELDISWFSENFKPKHCKHDGKVSIYKEGDLVCVWD